MKKMSWFWTMVLLTGLISCQEPLDDETDNYSAEFSSSSEDATLAGSGVDERPPTFCGQFGTLKQSFDRSRDELQCRELQDDYIEKVDQRIPPTDIDRCCDCFFPGTICPSGQTLIERSRCEIMNEDFRQRFENAIENDISAMYCPKPNAKDIYNCCEMEESEPPTNPGAKLPETISVEVEHKGQTYKVELRRHTMRAPGFEFYTFDDRRAKPTQRVTNIPEPRTYRGHVTNDKSLVATGVVDAKGLLRLTLWTGYRDKGVWLFNDIPIEEGLSTSASGFAKFESAELRDSSFVLPGMSNNRLQLPTPGTNFHSKLVRVRAHYFSGSFQDERFANGDLAMSLADIEGTLNELDYVFGRYLGIRHDLAWAQIDLHGNDDTGYGLYWPGYNEQGQIETNVSYNFSAWGGGMQGGYSLRGHPGGGRVGTAWLHEVGHLFGNGHRNPIPMPSVMGSYPYISQMQSRLGLLKLQNNGNIGNGRQTFAAKPFHPDTSPMLPAAYMDYITLYQGQTGSVRPLENDFDANGEALSIATFDTTTQQGGTVKLVSGNTLHYTPKANHVGPDTFTYTVQDAGGYKTTQTIHVLVHPKGLAGDWPIDNDTTQVTDRGIFGQDLFTKDGTLEEALIPGTQGDSLRALATAANECVLDLNGNKHLPQYFDPGHLSFTASIWFKYSQIGGDNPPYGRRAIVGKGSIYPEDLTFGGWEIRAEKNTLVMKVGFRNRFMADNMLEIRWPEAIQDGKWHHAVLFIDRASGLLTGYLDGEEHPNPAIIPNHGAPIVAAGCEGAYHTGQTFRVGEHTQEPSGGSAWDCLKIYHVALTPNQIRAATCPVKTN